MTGQHVVYVLVDAADQPLYVGTTGDIKRRVAEHTRKPWAHLVERVEEYPMVDRQTALHVERNLIAQIHPEFNQQSIDQSRHPVETLLNAPLRDLYQTMGVAPSDLATAGGKR